MVIAGPTAFGPAEPQGFADDRGRFELPRLFGKLLMYARSPKGELAGYATAGDDDDTGVVVVARPAATARGRVVDSANKPRAGVRIHCWMNFHLGAVEGPSGAGQYTDTDPEGRFILPGLPVGALCRVSVFNLDGGNARARFFAVKDASPIDLGAIVLDPARREE